MPQLFRRKPIAALTTYESPEHSRKRVRGADDRAGRSRERARHLAVEPVACLLCGYRHSLLRNG
jgi:hypothetical protein